MTARAIGERRRKSVGIGEIIRGKPGGPKPPGTRRTGQPVRRNSRHRGEREEQMWRSFGPTNRHQRRFIGAWLQAAEQFEERRKELGRRNGPLGHIGIRVLREMFRIANWKTGQLEPAIATICERIRRSRAAVVAAMARLKEHGFLDWIRRTEPTDNVGAGPQVRQITNAYGFDLQRLGRKAAAAASFVKKAIGFGIPIPDDELDHQARSRADAMLEGVSCEEAADVLVEDDQLREAFADLGRALDRSASSPGGQNSGHRE